MALFLRQDFHSGPIFRNTFHHIQGTPFQIDAGSFVFGVFLQHLAEFDAGFGKLSVIVKL
jgi:hypothetical protein